MTQLRQLLNAPLVPLLSLSAGVLLALIGLWTSGAVRDVCYSLALLSLSFWAVLATHKLWRVGQRIQTVEAATARGSVPAWARPMASQLSEVKDTSRKLARSSAQSLTAVEQARLDVKALATDAFENTSGSTELPAELLAVLPSRYDANISAETALDLVHGLLRTMPETISVVGMEPLRKILGQLLDAQTLDSQIVLVDPHHRGIELGLIDVLLIDACSDAPTPPTVTFLGALPAGAEIWILGPSSARSSLAEQLIRQDQGLAHVIRPRGSQAVTMLGKAMS